MATTFNNIITAFGDFKNSHYQINTFFFGETWDFQSSQDNVYPAMILLPQPSTIERGMITFNFSVFVCDILNKDRTNAHEIYSDCAQIIADLVSEMKDKEDDYGFWLDETNVLMEPFTEAFDDVLCGWVASINIQVKYVGSSCGLPLND
jgi:hypothetical protein